MACEPPPPATDATQLHGVVEAVCASPTHSMAKLPAEEVRLIAGFGIEGDVHAGAIVRKVSRRRGGDPPNLRQVHLIAAELHEELAARGLVVVPGQMGENITTRGLDLVSLSRGTLLHLGTEAVLEVTGLRHPCRKLDGAQPGLMKAVLDHDAEGRLTSRAGVMSVVRCGGSVRPGDRVVVEPPPGPSRPLTPV